MESTKLNIVLDRYIEGSNEQQCRNNFYDVRFNSVFEVNVSFLSPNPFPVAATILRLLDLRDSTTNNWGILNDSTINIEFIRLTSSLLHTYYSI